MTGPLDESGHVARILTDDPQRWLGRLRGIRTVCLAASDDGQTWIVETDEDDLEPGVDGTNVRLAIVTADHEAFQVDLPVKVLRELGRHINELTR